MCIIIAKPKNKTIPLEHLKQSANANPDGGGVMWIDDKNEIRIIKHLTSVSKLLDGLHDRQKDWQERDVIFHFRIGTSGETNIENVHPFYVNDTLAFCHNGVLSDYSFRDSKYSDTIHFNEKILKKLPKGFLSNDVVRDLLNNYIESSKLAFLWSERKQPIYIIGEKKGWWDEGIWYSNKSYERKIIIKSNKELYGGYSDYDKYGPGIGYSGYNPDKNNYNTCDDKCDDKRTEMKCIICKKPLEYSSEREYGVCHVCQGYIPEDE